jgi:hypothetical protein
VWETRVGAGHGGADVYDVTAQAAPRQVRTSLPSRRTRGKLTASANFSYYRMMFAAT